MAVLDFRTRERIVLFAGAAAAATLALAALAAIAGHSLGTVGDQLATVLVVFYLCGRIAAHARTLEEREENHVLARAAWLASPALTLVLLLQVVQSHTSVQALNFPYVNAPVLAAPTAWSKLEWTADIAVFALFLVTCMAVWRSDTDGVSAATGRIVSSLVGLFALDFAAVVWGVVQFPPQWRALAGLLVISLFGPIVVAILRRVERLDEEPAAGPPSPLPVAPVVPTAPQSLTPQP